MQIIRQHQVFDQGDIGQLNNRGFTLLELLISITMLALITGIMGWTLSMAHRTLDKGERKIHYLERVKVSFSLVESQIQSLFSYQYDDEGEKKLFFSGGKDKLMFTSNYSLWRGTRGNTFVTYDIQTNEKGKQFLRITEQIIGLEAKDEAIIFDDCTSINFEYFLKNAFEKGKWVDQWPADQMGLPDKIKINITYNTKKIALMVNLLVKPITTLAAAVITK
jgi:prepilin-type N-terminal cleavage/methylation domain-containing protein